MSMDQVARVAAVASTCVQPEVSHRPFMGEVVRALMLVRGEGYQVEQTRYGPGFRVQGLGFGVEGVGFRV